MNLQIAIATHKKYWMPKDSIYLPVHAGAAGKTNISLNYQRDDDGENISLKNPNYCELTALYWLWKNSKAEYLGLAHYRRHFTREECSSQELKQWNILTDDEWGNLLKTAPVVVPDKRKYYIESNYSHYIHAHHKEGLDTAEQVIREIYPEYVPAMEQVWKRTWAHMFNMFVMRRDCFNAYCTWLFHVLSEVEKRLDISGWDKSEARVYGYISELLLDVWLETNKIAYKEQNVSFMENQNWLKKGGKFLLRKVLGKNFKLG